jgi:hypothetical protein
LGSALRDTGVIKPTVIVQSLALLLNTAPGVPAPHAP